MKIHTLQNQPPNLTFAALNVETVEVLTDITARLRFRLEDGTTGALVVEFSNLDGCRFPATT